VAKPLLGHRVMDKNKIVTKIVWGVILTLAGIGVFFRIPQVMPKIEKIEYFSSFMYYIRFCFYLLGILLIWGGVKRIYENYRKLKDK
jgi:Na+/H+-dicarboxylate symporter